MDFPPFFSPTAPFSTALGLFAVEQGGSLPSISYKERALRQTASLAVSLSSQPHGEQGHTVLGAWLSIRKVIVMNLVAGPKPLFSIAKTGCR